MSSTTQMRPLRRTATRLVAIGAMTALAAGLSACATRGDSASTDDSKGREVKQIAIVAPETEADHGWNAQGLAGVKEAADSLGIKADINDNVGYDNTQTILTQVAKKGNDLVIAHASGFSTAADRANASTGVPMLAVTNEKAMVKGKVGVITFEAQQGAYLAGIAAAMTTKTKTVGIVSSADDINWYTMSGGFVQGVRSVDPSIKIVVAYIGSAGYADSAGGKKVASQVIAAGADVIIGFGDGATVGYVAAVEEAATPVKYIATIGSVDELVKDKSTILTTVSWNFGKTIEKAVKDVEAGTFAQDFYTLDVPNGGISLTDTDNMTAEIDAAVETAKKGIEDGSITVEKTKTKKEFDAFYDQK
ncbi:putative B6 ABC transporter substrate-binding protein [Schumannella soli]|uniref:BMP family ABC transporter substrate-binding protein n=1 Tax=Schumannella soli TaxID=2590779 RepID=A0A506Y7C5_9MICO|nr:BMP family ABC transporter substrate-binding protein [Schumannella soli]TPW77420.1 BMP family ABC transporter substrate-binding protein [Schumannella soli]